MVDVEIYFFAYRNIDASTSDDPMPKFTVGTKLKTGIESRQESMIAQAIARFFKLLSANLMTIAVNRPPMANMKTTIQVVRQNP